MKIDLHIHSNYSDGQMTLPEIFKEASERGITALSITDHDSIDGQAEAKRLASRYNIRYIVGLELSVSFFYPKQKASKPISLDFLAYQYDMNDPSLAEKLDKLREYRKNRAEQILERINRELVREKLKEFTGEDLDEIEKSVDGAFGRPHIADYMVRKGIVASRKEAFDKYLVKCNVPKMPLSMPEASELVKNAGGKIMLAHPNHPRGTSLIKLTSDLGEQQEIIRETMMPYIDGIECWHSEHDQKTIHSYLKFAKKMGFIVTGGSDCHQKPLRMGTVDVPAFVAEQFNI